MRLHIFDIERRQIFDIERRHRRLETTELAILFEAITLITAAIRFDGSIKTVDTPNVFRDEILEYKQQLNKVADIIYELLSEALNVDPSYLKSMNLAAMQNILCHYYPPCPEPEFAVGTTKHEDPTFLTLLIQDSHGGLQILHDDQWVPIIPVPGTLICNIGDLL